MLVTSSKPIRPRLLPSITLPTRLAPLMLSLAFLLVLLIPGNSSAAESGPKPEAIDAAIHKGLEWLKRNQSGDGHWEAPGGQYPTTMTAIAGLALLMEGSTLRDGKYMTEITKAVDWFLKRAQANGMLGDPRSPTEASRYIYGHGFGMLFLASVYGEEDDLERRKKLEVVLKKAVEFSGKAQTNKGGWGYVSSKDGGGFDEGSTTITQLQGIRACKNAGIPVPKKIIEDAQRYLQECTTSRGGVVYNHPGGRLGAAAGGERPPITAAAVACAFSSGQYNDKYAKMWIKFCKDNLRRQGHDVYAQYYWGQAMYVLGDDRYAKLFPDDDRSNDLTWSKYKAEMIAEIVRTQSNDGSWTGNGGYGIGPVFVTSAWLTLLQLEKSVLPIYHR